jgi:hypothetical protein
MADESAVHVNFGKPIALFPLDGVALFPHQVVPLHIFEPRYRQMTSDALDASGLIAMAVYADRTGTESGSPPPLRRATCLGTIVRHETLPDGRFNLLLQGVCRARIIEEAERKPGRLYRSALLEPLEDPAMLSGDVHPKAAQLHQARAEIGRLLSEGVLRKLVAAEPLLEYVRNDDVSTPAVLELVTSVLAREDAIRYELLAQPDAGVRADTLLSELRQLERLVQGAVRQQPERWPKGMSWN